MSGKQEDEKPRGRAGMLLRLDELIKECSEDGWYGHSGYALDDAAVSHTREIIERCDEDVLDFFNLFPSPNATLSFETRERVVCAMSVGQDGFSYACVREELAGRPEEVMKGTVKPFDADAAVAKLKEMKGFFSEEDIRVAGALHLARKVAMNCDLRAIGSKTFPIFDTETAEQIRKDGELFIDWECERFTKPKKE